MFEPGAKKFENAKARFTTTREANEMGDPCSLAGVLLAISLFFGGIALVFKSSVRWGFFSAGTLALTSAT